jgi:hypothetical protein
MNSDFFVTYAWLAKRWGWRFVPVAVLVWTVFWPISVAWSAITLLRRHMSRDHRSVDRTERRVARLLAWYPPAWRTRYGAEFSELLRDEISSGQGGLTLTLNVMRESSDARIVSAGGIAAATCWWLCWLPLFAQGIVPLILKVAGTPIRSWFLALYPPAPYQWAIITVMIAIGLAMLATAIHAGAKTRHAV